MFGLNTAQHSTPSFHRYWNPQAHITEISYFVIFTFHLSTLTSWPFTWAEVVEVVVTSIRQVPGEGGGVDCGRGGGIGAQRKPPMEQILLLHPDNLLVPCRGRSERRRKYKKKKIQIRTKFYFQDFHLSNKNII